MNYFDTISFITLDVAIRQSVGILDKLQHLLLIDLITDCVRLVGIGRQIERASARLMKMTLLFKVILPVLFNFNRELNEFTDIIVHFCTCD